MENSIASQAYIFFSTLYGGIIIGFIYDLYRIFRFFFKPKKIATYIEDLVFWIIVSFIALLILVFSNWGEIRGYVFLGFISGAFLYSKLLSKTVITVLIHIIRILARFFKYIFNIVFYPFRLLWSYLYIPYKKMSSKTKTALKRLKKILGLPFIIIKDIKKYVKVILRKK